jgi:1-deoxy-D-xylulose-5-phosphate synthase
VVAVYSTFLQRAYDQIVHDVCLQNLPVIFAIDRGGIVGEDGPTHHGVFDLSYLRHIPNMTVMVPRDENELRRMLKTAVEHGGPAAARYPRGTGLGVDLATPVEALPVGKGEILREGDHVLLAAVGVAVHEAMKAARTLEEDGIQAAVVNARFIKPLDRDLLLHWAKHCRGRVITVEENVVQGGFGSAVLEMFADAGWFPRSMVRLGIPDRFVPHGAQAVLRRELEIDAEAVRSAALRLCRGGHGRVVRAFG